MPSQTKAQREGAAKKRAKAIALGQTDDGVTDVELAEAVGSKAIGAMAAIFSRMKKANHMQPSGLSRNNRSIWKTTGAGTIAYSREATASRSKVAKKFSGPKKAAEDTKQSKAAKVVDVRDTTEEISKAAMRVSDEASRMANDAKGEAVFVGSLEIIGGLRHVLSGLEKMIRTARMTSRV